MATQIPTGQVTTQNIVTNQDTVWSIQFAPNGHMFWTERLGRVRVFDGNSTTTVVTITATEVLSAEEGLQGFALSPTFGSDNFFFVYYSYDSNGIKNRVVRYTYDPNTKTASSPLTILDAIPGFQYHVGGRIRFGPDNKLYVCVGDAADNNSQAALAAQDVTSLNGKILRINTDGSAPSDNPFFANSNANAKKVYTLGHRNPQGIDWDTAGRCWQTEHGPTSTSTNPQDNDELNLLTPGANYGWPYVYGQNIDNPNFTTPGGFTHVLPTVSSGTTTWAPADSIFYSGDVYGDSWKNSVVMTGLGIEGRSSGGFIDGRAVYRIPMSAVTPGTLTRFFHNQLGRLRALAVDADGYIYVSTSNRDGRGPAVTPAGDDRIFKLIPQYTTLQAPTNISASPNGLSVTVTATANNTDTNRSGIAIYRKTTPWGANDDPSTGTEVSYQTGTVNTTTTITQTLAAGTYYYAAFTVNKSRTPMWFSNIATAPAVVLSEGGGTPTGGWSAAAKRSASAYPAVIVLKPKSITASVTGSTVNVTVVEPIDTTQLQGTQTLGRTSAKLYRKNSPWTNNDTTGAVLVRTFEGT
jgi:glucose/arabinose dehydrogenase